MSETSSPAPDKTWLSSFLLVLGVLALLASVVAFFSGGLGFAGGLCGLAMAAVLFALGRILDCLYEIRQRLARLESDRNKDVER